MSQDIWNGKWLEVKGEILNQWGTLIGDDLDRVKGNIGAVVGMIQQKYGETKEQIQEKIDQLHAGVKSEAQEHKDSIVKTAADESQEVKQSVRESMT